VFGQLAGRLAEAGFVVLRYDARGIGRSGGRTENATIDEYADDVVRVVNWLRRRDDVDNDRIAVVGYGDAGPVALRAAAREDRIKGVALLAAPGRSGREVIIEQQQLMLGRIGIPEAEQAMRQALQYRIIDAAISGEGWETIPPELRVQAETPWFRSWLLFEPAEAFRRMDQPVLIVHGELDAEVPVAHADALETLSRQRDRGRIAERYTRLVALPSVNHLLVPSDRGDVEEYETLETLQIAPEVPEAIATWMNDLLPRR
jgi:pimeloyl-ACP methyl ester carboxylesterase